jgi:hypothetical protein
MIAVCSASLPVTDMLTYAAFSIVFMVVSIAVPHMAASIAGGTIGLALSHAFESAHIAQTVVRSISSALQAGFNKLAQVGGGKGADASDAPAHLREELAEDYRRMIYAETHEAVEQARRGFVRKWKLRCQAAYQSFEEAGDQPFTFTAFPISQWKALRTTNALERINEEFGRRTKIQASLPNEEGGRAPALRTTAQRQGRPASPGRLTRYR